MVEELFYGSNLSQFKFKDDHECGYSYKCDDNLDFWRKALTLSGTMLF